MKQYKAVYVFRSAVTGKFVSARYAARYPKKTIRQRIYRSIFYPC